MRIKNYINQFVAILTFVTLVSGFQISTNDGMVNTIESAIGIEEAYAGPCGNKGCTGKEGFCTSYVVLEIGGIQVVRYCSGIKRNDDDEIVPM